MASLCGLCWGALATKLRACFIASVWDVGTPYAPRVQKRCFAAAEGSQPHICSCTHFDYFPLSLTGAHAESCGSFESFGSLRILAPGLAQSFRSTPAAPPFAYHGVWCIIRTSWAGQRCWPPKGCCRLYAQEREKVKAQLSGIAIWSNWCNYG